MDSSLANRANLPIFTGGATSMSSLDHNTLDSLRIKRDAPPPRTGSVGRFLVGLGAVGIVVASITGWVRRDQPVEVAAITVQPPSETTQGGRTLLNASGYVVARREATVSAKMTGKVTEVLIEEGMKVTANQVLARLDDTNTKANLALAEAQLASSRAALAETIARMEAAQNEFKRVTDLAANGVSSAADLDHAKAEFTSLKARLDRQQVDVEVASRQVDVWKQQVEDTVVRAPFV